MWRDYLAAAAAIDRELAAAGDRIRIAITRPQAHKPVTSIRCADPESGPSVERGEGDR